MLTRAGRRRRGAATAAALVLLLAGTAWGSDDDFPFGPFRMYAGRNDPNGVVGATTLEAVLPGGRVVTVDERATGMRRAELEGRLDQFQADPALLATVAAAHARLHPHEAPYAEVRVRLRAYRLHHAAIATTTDRILADWRRP
ncbi:MAG: hypothetical protein ACJ74O_11985 [Frankiaceae bacterium]